MINKKVISLVLSLALIVSCFASLASLGVYAIDNTKKTTSLQTAPVVTTTTAEKKAARTVVDAYPVDDYPTHHCECGNIWIDNTTGATHYLWGEGNCKNDGNKGCDGTILEWTALSTNPASGSFNAGGNYYLTADITSQAQQAVDTNNTARFDLNGYKFIRNGGRAWGFASRTNVTLTVTDTKGGGEMQVNNYPSKNQGALFLVNANGGTWKFYGGKYVVSTKAAGNITYGAMIASTASNAGIYFFEGAIVDCSASNTGTSTANGGAIAVSGAGSNFAAYGATFIGAEKPNANGGTFNFGNTTNGNVTALFENCTISGGKAKSGGNIHVTGKNGAVSRVDLVNTTVTGGEASENGGNIVVATYGRVYTDGATITGGNAGAAGGNVYVIDSGARYEQVASAADSAISNGTAGTTGGNINHAGGTIIVRNTNITNGTATEKGGNIYSNSNFTLTSCSVSGGTAATGSYNGQDIYVNGNLFQVYGNTTVAGEFYYANNTETAREPVFGNSPTLSNFIIGAPHAATADNTYYNTKIDFTNLSSDADITLTVDADENFLGFAGQNFASLDEAIMRDIAIGVTDDIVDCFTVTNEGYVFLNDNGTGHLGVYVPPVPTHTHKIAANSASAAAKKFSQEEVTYTAVTTEEELAAAIAGVEAGTPLNIYLDANIELTEKTVATDGASGTAYGLRIPVAGAVVNICLNGHTLSAYDGGEDAATNASQIFQFGAGTASNYSQLHICDCAEGAAKGGLVGTRTVDSSSAVQYAGIGYVGNQGRVYLYDTKVTGCASKTAGIVRAATGFFQAYDTVFNNPANAHDAFVGTGANSAFKFYGCTMNIANESAVKLTAATTSDTRATVLENCTITSNATDPVVTIPGLVTLDGTTITAADATPLELSGTATATITNSNLSSTNKVALIVPENTTANITGGTISSTNGNAFVVPAGATVNVTGDTAITSALDDADSSSATVMVQGAFTMTGGSIANTGTEFAIYPNDTTADCTLNNVTLTASGNRTINVAAGTTATLNNCTVSSTATTVANGGLVYNFGTLYINGGTYNGVAVSAAGGALYNGNKNATLNIYGDAVINGADVGTNAGAIYNNAGTLNIYGTATVNGASVGNRAGAIYNNAGSDAEKKGTVNIYGNAVINGGTATTDGGAIYNTANGIINIYENATIQGATAARGGNIFNIGGTVSISGSAKIKDGTAYNAESYSGGQGGGGNIYSTSSGTFTIGEGVEISGGEASGNGGNIYNNATMTITGATVTGGQAGHNGGNIIFSSSTAEGTTITDSSITNGHANRGGNIYHTNNTNVSLVGTTVSGGTIESNADSFGADVMIYANEEATPATIYGDANCTIGKVAMVYPFAQNNFAEGTYNSTVDYVTLNATKEDMVKSSTITEKVAGENPDSAFNNWYLLARGQKKTDGSNWIRFTSLVDEGIEDYYAAGYFITVEGEETANMETHDVYKTNYESGVAKQIGDYSLSSDYYFHVDLEFSADDIAAGKTITIKPYLQDYNGNYYYGATKTASLAKLFPATVPVEGE